MRRSLQHGVGWLLEIFGEDQQQFLNMVLFMVLPPEPVNKPLILNDINGSFTIEWE